MSTNGIPCIAKKFSNEVYKVIDKNVTSKFQGLGSVNPVVSKGNYVSIDMSGRSYPDEKWGSATIFSNGKNIGTFSLDGTSLGEEITSVIDKSYDAQDNGSKFKIGWVLCKGQVYIYDMMRDGSTLKLGSEKNMIRGIEEDMDVSSDSEYYQERKREVSIPFDDLSMLSSLASRFCENKENFPDCRQVRRIISRHSLFM
jgi:hypothetical protein